MQAHCCLGCERQQFMALEMVCIVPIAYMLVSGFCMGPLLRLYPIGYFLELAGILYVVTIGRLLCWPQYHFCMRALRLAFRLFSDGGRAHENHWFGQSGHHGAGCRCDLRVLPSCALGMQVQTFGDGRLALKFGQQKINIHEAVRLIPRRIGLRLAWLTCVCLWRIRGTMWFSRFMSIMSTIWVQSAGQARMGPSPRCTSGTPIGT